MIEFIPIPKSYNDTFIYHFIQKYTKIMITGMIYVMVWVSPLTNDQRRKKDLRAKNE